MPVDARVGTPRWNLKLCGKSNAVFYLFDIKFKKKYRYNRNTYVNKTTFAITSLYAENLWKLRVRIQRTSTTDQQKDTRNKGFDPKNNYISIFIWSQWLWKFKGQVEKIKLINCRYVLKMGVYTDKFSRSSKNFNKTG